MTDVRILDSLFFLRVWNSVSVKYMVEATGEIVYSDTSANEDNSFVPESHSLAET